MSRQPKEGATEWTLKVEHVSMDLYWPFRDKAQSERMEFGKWVLKVLTEASRKELPPKRNKKTRKEKAS